MKKLLSNIFLPTLLGLCSYLTIYSQSTYFINDPEEIEDRTYVAGDEIILANGIYTNDERIDFIGMGTFDQPIVFRAESPGGVQFTGGLPVNIGGDYLVVEGFHWKGGFGASNFIQFRNGTIYSNHSTIQNCVIDGLAIHPDDIAEDNANNSITKHRWIVLYGTHNSILNCSFMNKESAGALILAEYQYNAESNPCQTVGHSIINNYFYRYTKIDNTLSNSGDSETIRIGSSEYQNINSNAIVSKNYFVESDGENEIITNKSKGNIYTNNTFRRCRGSLVLRHGSNALVDGNYFLGENIEGTGGIRITDSNHTITNNYIQDCITENSQSKWNNGITFIGGNDNNSVACTSNNVSNGYQKSENIILSNNSFVNTHSPLFYNTDKGTTDPTGSVTNNLFYFSNGNPNISEIITGDTPTAYTDLGSSLIYQGNVYIGSDLGVTQEGFIIEPSITPTSEGEIFTFSGMSIINKGANLNNYIPSTDEEVGYGIGACFTNNTGQNISDGDCSINIIDQLAIGSLLPFSSDSGSAQLTVIANVSWTAEISHSWISIDSNSGNGNANLSIMVTANNSTDNRTGTITFRQAPGGDDITRTITITQEGINLTDLYDLINIGTGAESDKVRLHSFSKEEVNGIDKFNYAQNTLDKNDETLWAADDDEIIAGENKGDGEYIIYDLGSIHTIDLIQYSTTNKSDAFGFQVWFSTTETEDSDFIMILPTSGDLLLTATNSNDFNQYEINGNQARYIKLIGFGRFDNEGEVRTSVWSAVREIEFYGNETVSTNLNENEQIVKISPSPAQDILSIKNVSAFDLLTIRNMNGEKVLEQVLSNGNEKYSLDITSINSGIYIITFSGPQHIQSQQLLIFN